VFVASATASLLLPSCSRNASNRSNAPASRPAAPQPNAASRAAFGRPTDPYSTVLLDRDGGTLASTTAPVDADLLRCHAAQAGDLSFQLDRPIELGSSISFSTTRYSVVLAGDALARVVGPGGSTRGAVTLGRDVVLVLDLPTIALRAHTRLARLPRFADRERARDATARACVLTASTLVAAALVLGGYAAQPLEDVAHCGPAIVAWSTAVFFSIQEWSAHALA
jgi:hypothetical protein